MEVLEKWGIAGVEEYGSISEYFSKHSCTIPEKTRLSLSEDGHTVTLTAYEGYCFENKQATITVWAQPRGDIVVSAGTPTLSADKKTLTFRYGTQKIYKVSYGNAAVIQPTLTEGSGTHFKWSMSFNASTNKNRIEVKADYGYKIDAENSYFTVQLPGSPSPSYYYFEGDDKVCYLDIFIRSGSTVQLGITESVDADEPLNATITNNLPNTSYVIRYGGVLEITSDLYYFPRANAKVLANNTEQTLNVDNDFYYEQKSVMTCDVSAYLATAGTIVLQGDMYHRDWRYCTIFDGTSDTRVTMWVDEDVLIIKCNTGYRFELTDDIERPDDSPWYPSYLKLYVNRDNVRYYATPNASFKQASINLSAWNSGGSHWVHGNKPVKAPTGDVTMQYSLTNCSVQGTAPSTLNMDGHLELTLVANNGYQFNTAPTLRYYNNWNNAVSVQATVSQDKLSASFDWYPASVALSDSYPSGYDFLISGSAAVAPPAPFEATIVNNISGTTYNQANDTINVYAPNGYVFSAAPTLDWTDGTNSGTANFTLAADGKSATINAAAWKSSAYTLTIQGAIEEEHTWGPASITNNVANTTHSLSGTTLTVVCDTGYVFDAAPVIAQAGGAGPITMTLNSSGTIASADITAYDELAVVITGSTSESTEPPTPSTNHTVYTRLTNCTGSGIPGVVDDDDALNITLTANSGYEFDANYLPSVEYIKSDNLTYREYFTLSSDGSTATITLNTANLGLKADSALTVVGQAYETEPTPPGPEPPYTEKYGLVNIYNPTASELQQFAAQRFRYDQNLMPFDDLGNYVTSLKRVYVTMPATTDTTISAGRYNTSITSRTPVTDIVNLDFGSILLPAHNLDVLDGNSKISVFLPFVGFVDVNPEFCGSSIALTYQVNIVTGEGVAKLSRNNIIFAIYPCRPSTDMAYRSNTMMSQTLGGSEFNTMYLYGLQPYATVKWYTSMNQHLLNNDCHRGVIGTYHGYAKFTEVTDINNGQITAEEKNLLIRTLAGGVYIETNEP